MVNKNYLSGRRFEYKVKKLYEQAGYTVLRTSGSHGFADLVAVKNGARKQILFIQCKNRKATKSELDKLHEYEWLITTTAEMSASVVMVYPEILKGVKL